ncbi:conserved hypothetical protein [Luminiphilus syltensis NOR5-1B]|uniref:DUF3187 family protein n=1 Tax=Luminiphilus syltensis NOR5-1B TaxID=565045 RepID=B8KSU9_9GAMM|nr:conserved hypothetical protein [Luminiphilus syltensis NOR5-1B]
MPTVADSMESAPLAVENLSPFSALRSFPAQRRADTEAGFAVDLNQAVASHFIEQSRADSGEALFIDGETMKLSATLRYGFADSWDISATVPWVKHSEGFLDGAINSWHDFFGMSDGGRSDYPNDQFIYAYGSPGFEQGLRQPARGIGDTTVALNRVFHRAPGQSASLGLGYIIATGDESGFLGGGAGNAFVTLRFSGAHPGDFPLTWHGQLGYMRAGETDLLSDSQRRNLWFAGLSMDWQIADQWSLLAQYDGHSALTASELGALGEASALLSFGARWKVAQDWSLEALFIEDIKVESGPDITFQFAIRYRGRPR